LLKTPQRHSRPAGASGLTLDSLDNKDPTEKRESDDENATKSQSRWRVTAEDSSCRGSPGETASTR
jgi:hypothetical protein